MASMRGDLQTMEPLLAAAEAVIGRTDHERFEPSTGPAGSLLVNVRAMLALQRSYAAQLRGDAEATAAMTREAMTHLGQDELMLTSAVQGFLATAEWLRGRLAAAQQGFSRASAGGAGRARSPPRPGGITAWPACSGARDARCRGPDVRASPGRGGPARAGPAAGRRARAHRPGRGGVPARRRRPGAGLRHPGDDAVPSVRPHPAADGRAGPPGLDPPGGRRPGTGRRRPSRRRSRSPGPLGLLNPVPAQRAAAAAGSGRRGPGGPVVRR